MRTAFPALPYPVIPAKAGIQGPRVSEEWLWIPAYAGMTNENVRQEANNVR
ncbi:hypothetical protein SAMN06265365_14623 [Tistlia consotensis]|uniref:Uncharacterized protein n=1 Tax=Tistlia consotensis USBA 355 TaxID=560819 RepID=A0A1Y6CRC5_9PROT|nr:hypothetical protein SAMN05428998_14724 [Tistlia consotensis USBA 355]SNS29703.1 hypothetical protein SAMN06265365_14623 [Tistlia consotensis]